MSKLHKQILTILVPVYNEENTLEAILKRATSLKIEDYEVIIVDDCSKDRSPEIIRQFLDEFKSDYVHVKTVRHAKNSGKGAAIQTAIKIAKGKYFVIQDADLEYYPEDLPKLLKCALKYDYDSVYGSRFLGSISGMAKANYLANRFYNFMLRRLYPTSITDMHTCYKMVRTRLIKDIGMSANGFDYATELISKLLKRGITIHEVPIRFKGRTKKEGKKIDIMDGIECTYKLLRFRFNSTNKLFGEKSTTFGRFIIVGGVGFIVNYLILVVLTQFGGLNHIVAEVLAVIVALQVTFALHDRWTYQIHTPPGTQKLNLPMRYTSFIVSNSFGSLITVVVFGFLYEYLTRLTALLLAAITGVFWNYLMNTYVIWRRKK